MATGNFCSTDEANWFMGPTFSLIATVVQSEGLILEKIPIVPHIEKNGYYMRGPDLHCCVNQPESSCPGIPATRS